MDFLNNRLATKTSMFGLKLWAVICIGVGVCVILIVFVALLWLRSRRNSTGRARVLIHKDSIEVGVDRRQKPPAHQHLSDDSSCSPSSILDHRTLLEKQMVHAVDVAPFRAHNLDKADREYKGARFGRAQQAARGEDVRREIANRVPFPCMEKGGFEGEMRQPHSLDKDSSSSGDSRSADSPSLVPAAATGISVPEASDLGWGHCYTQQELEVATDSFSDANVLGEGSYGIVYHGQLPDGTCIALKNLLNNRGQAEKEFKIEVEAIGRVRHKNLVRLIGYCMKGSQRMLVYEYIDNGNLEQWLHGPLGDLPPLSWDIRMKIILGTARGLAYLHEGLEPKVVHRDVKSSNILLDSQWNAKVSDFGLAKLLGAGNSHVTTRVMGTFGYVAPEYASTGMLTEKSDVFSYGVLVMELVTGRVPVDISRPPGEVNLVDWLKAMVGSRRSDEVADPKMEVKPSPRALKRALLVALRCVDPDAQRRPKMGHVVHMLEAAEDNPFCEEQKNVGEHMQARNSKQTQTILQKYGVPMEPSSLTAAQQHNQAERAIQKWKGTLHNDHVSLGTADTKAMWRYER